MLTMRKFVLILTVFMPLIASCATREIIPVAASCPPPAPAPKVLVAKPSTEPPLIEGYKLLMQEFSDSLSAAIKQ